MLVRLRTENYENNNLSKFAALSSNSIGRDIPIEECSMRTVYQRDRDRIIHCKSFRRLKHKTQVFLSPEGDHYRTRLTHTLEVSQISRTIARALMLNEDLTEAIALGHDLGHTPFGHAGESALNDVSKNGFKHYEQSVRVVETLEKLNLTYEVRNGILCHTKGKQADTLEGQIVRLADRIAYINHDIDDAIRAGVLTNQDIPLDILEVLGDTSGKRIDCLVKSIAENSIDDNINMNSEVKTQFDALHKFMYAKVYRSPYAKAEEKKIPDLVNKLYNYFMTHTDKLDDNLKTVLINENADRAVCDYIAGMTDQYAIQLYQELFVPKNWSK